MTGTPPKAVKKRDLKPDVTEDKAHQETATAMVSFMDQIIFGKRQTLDIKTSTKVVQPLVDAIVMEGSFQLKPPCFDSDLVNHPSAKCAHGSPWHNEYTQRIMGGNLPGHNMKITNDDNFHRVQSVTPIHLSEIDHDCAVDSRGCTMETITVSENIYGQLDKLDTGYYQVAASEMKTKISSR